MRPYFHERKKEKKKMEQFNSVSLGNKNEN